MEPAVEPPVKKVLSADRLKKLAEARILANEARKRGKELKEKEQALKLIEHQHRVDEVEQKIKKLKIPEAPPAPPEAVVKKKKKIVYIEPSSSDDDNEVIFIKKPKKKLNEPEQETQFLMEPEREMSQAQIKQEMLKMRRDMARKMMFAWKN